MTKDNDLTTGPIPRLVAKLAIPASIGYLFNTMYNVVDTFFGGLISTQVLDALSLSLPVFFIIIAMGTDIATGATALFSIFYSRVILRDVVNLAFIETSM